MEPARKKAIQANIDRKAERRLARIENDARKRQQSRTPQSTETASSPHKVNERKYDRAQSNRQRDAATPPP